MFEWPPLRSCSPAPSCRFAVPRRQEACLSAYRGVSEYLLATMDLGKEQPELKGRVLRMRLITIAPGGAFAHHNHAAVTALSSIATF